MKILTRDINKWRLQQSKMNDDKGISYGYDEGISEGCVRLRIWEGCDEGMSEACDKGIWFRYFFEIFR